MTSVTAGVMPLYGMCVMRMLRGVHEQLGGEVVDAAHARGSVVELARDRARAIAKSSSVVCTGSSFATVSSIGPRATIATGAKPATGSYGRLGCTAALVVNEDDSTQSV